MAGFFFYVLLIILIAIIATPFTNEDQLSWIMGFVIVLFFIVFCYFEFLVKFVLEPLRSLSTTHIS